MSRDSVPFEHPWNESLIGEVADVIVGGTPSTAIPSFWGGTIPWMASGDVHLRHVQDVAGRITESGLRYSNAVMVDPPAIAMALAGQGKTRGTVALTHIPLCTNQSVALIRPDDKQLDPVFLFQSLIPRYEEMRSRSAGGGRAGLTKAIIERTPVQLPPPAQQRKIAWILTTVDNLIENTEALIAKYQAIKQGMMHDLFTRGVDEHGHLRPPYEEAPELYIQSELGWIPKDWDASSLGSYLASIDAGWSPDCIEQTPALGEWGVLKVSAVTSGEYVAAESKTLPSHLHPDVSLEVRAGDVLLARSNGVAELVGVTVRVEETRDKLMLSDKVLRLNPDRKRLSQAFLALTMKGELIRKQVGQVINGSSGQRNISQAEIRKLVFVVPPIQEQQLISSRLQSTQSQIHREMNAVAHLRQVKTGLMQDLLTGKVRVKVDEAKEVGHV